MNQEFYISVTPVRADEYLVRTERVSPGVPLAEEIVRWRVDEWLEQARKLMHDPLLGLLRGNYFPHRTGPSASESTPSLSPNLVELGQKFYNALFQGTIRDSWMTAQGIAQNRQEGLRLRLGLKGDQLPRLPWEVLHAGDRPLATGTDVVFSRYQASFAPMATVLQPHRSPVVEQNQPLRILMVLAAPTDQEVLELQREANHLREELLRDSRSEFRGEHTLGDIELTILNQPGREQLTQALEQGHYQVLHYAGHSNLGVSGGDLYLVSDRTGLTEMLSGDDLAGLLVNNGIRIAVFNSCRGVYTATTDPINDMESGNLTEALLKRGVPAVLAMAERIPDDVALNLSLLFYRNLKQRYPIDLSLSRARQGLLSSYGSNQLYWALPVLYLHPDFDGYLQPPFAPDPTIEGLESDDVNRLPNSQEFPTPVALPSSEGVVTPVLSDSATNLAEAEAMFSDLEFDDPDDDDRQAVLGLLRDLSQASSSAPEENPFGPQNSASGELFYNMSQGAIYADPSQSNGGLEHHYFGNLDLDVDEDELQSDEDCIALGQARYDQGDIAGAISAYGRALQLNPSAAEAYSKMGVALEQFSSPAEAIIAYKMALQLNPNLLEAQRNLERLEVAHNFQINQALSNHLFSNASTASGEPAGRAAAATLMRVEAPPPSRVFGEFRNHPPRRRPWVAIGVAGTAAAALLAVWGIWYSEPTTKALTDWIQGINLPEPEMPQSPTGELATIAVKSFTQGNLRQGQDAVKTLLDQGTLKDAQTALQAVPNEKLDVPAISFLRGRLAWQSLQSGNRNYSVEDSRRYWETTVKGNKSPQFYTALGFAYYAEGNLKRAGDAWFQAASLASRHQPSNNQSTEGKGNSAKQDELTAYAGLALVSTKSARNQSSSKRESLRREAVKLRDRVLKESPTEFQPEALTKNWLWTENAIKEWKALLKEK